MGREREKNVLRLLHESVGFPARCSELLEGGASHTTLCPYRLRRRNSWIQQAVSVPELVPHHLSLEG